MFNIYFKEMKKLIALFALVAVFAACEPESLQTAYTVADATAKVNVTLVTCPYPDFDPADVTFTYAWSSGTPTDDPTMVTGNPTIAAGSVAITAEYMGLTGTTTVGYPKVYAGGQYEFTATVAIPYNAGDYTLYVEFDDPEDPELLFYKVLQESIDHGTEILYPFEYMDETFEIPMVENASEMVLTDSYSYPDYTGFELEDDLTMVNDDFEDLVSLIQELTDILIFFVH